MKKSMRLEKQEAPPMSDIANRIKPVEELPFLISMLVYGRSGTGKTTFAATFPKPLLVLDIREKGTDSIRDVEGVQVLALERWEEFESIYWYLVEGKHNFETVVIDTVTQLQDLAVEKVLEDDGKSPGDLVSKGAWGTVASLMKSWIINYRDLPLNVVFLAQDRIMRGEEEVEEDQLTPEVGPRVIPSVASTLNAAVKVIGQTYISEVTKETKEGKLIRKVQYRLRIGPHAYYTTKIRQPKDSYTPEFLVNPSYDQIVQVMKGQYEPKGKEKS